MRADVTKSFLWSLVRPYMGRLAAGLVVLFFTTGAMLALPQFLKRMFDTALQSGDKAQLAVLSLSMMGVVLLLVLGVIARARLVQITALRIMSNLRQRVGRHLLTLDVAYYDKSLSGELISRVTSDTVVLREFIQYSMPMLVRGVLLGVGTLVMLVVTNASLTGLLLLAALPLVVVSVIMGRKLRVLSRRQTDLMAAWRGMMGEVVGQVRTIYAFDQQGRFGLRTDGQVEAVFENSAKQAKLTSLMISVHVAVGFAALIGVVWLGGIQVINQEFSLGGMMAFLLYLGFMADAVGNLSGFWPSWQNTVGSLERLMALLKEKPLIVDAAQPVDLPETSGGRALAFETVAYAYPTRPEHEVLHGFSLDIAAGARVALVGPSGGGKSTVFRLLQRLDDVQAGAVRVDGVDVREARLGDLRRSFALVAQDSPMFAGTVRENVSFGVPAATEAHLWEALELAHAAGFVRQLPKGLDTVVGERGVQLSGGQRQRLALARAIVLDAPVLLLDEATSHLDTESEKLVQAALERLAQEGRKRTVVTIAHRLSTVMAADRIFVVEGGHVVASGTHAELLETCDLYRGLAAGQLA